MNNSGNKNQVLYILFSLHEITKMFKEVAVDFSNPDYELLLDV